MPCPPEALAEILTGAIDKANEAGIAIVGGHTIQTEEPIFGLAVIGRVDPRKVITNAGAQPGDFLILTKPLGLGIITTAAKRSEDHAGAIAEAIGVMTMLNRDAAGVFTRAGAHALTDITGFGLLGHLRSLASASGVSALVWNDLVPVLPAAREYVRQGIAPGGTHANMRFLADWVDTVPDITESRRTLAVRCPDFRRFAGRRAGRHRAFGRSPASRRRSDLGGVDRLDRARRAWPHRGLRRVAAVRIGRGDTNRRRREAVPARWRFRLGSSCPTDPPQTPSRRNGTSTDFRKCVPYYSECSRRLSKLTDRALAR